MGTEAVGGQSFSNASGGGPCWGGEAGGRARWGRWGGAGGTLGLPKRARTGRKAGRTHAEARHMYFK